MNAQHTATPVPINRVQQDVKKKVQPHDHVKNLKSSEQYLFLVMLLELGFLNVSLLGALSFVTPLGEVAVQHPSTILYFILTINALAFGVAFFTKMFRAYEDVKINLKIGKLVASTLIYFGILGFLYNQFFYPIFEVHFLLPACCTFLAFAGITHYSYRYFSRNWTNYLTYAVIGGGTNSVNNLENIFSNAYGKRTYCVGRFGENHISEVDNLGSFQDIKNYLQFDNNINKLLYIDSNLSQVEVQELVQVCRNQFVDFEVVPQAVNFFDKGMQVEQVSTLPIFSRKKEPLCALPNKILKRAFDIVFSSLVIVFIYPWLMPLIALLIKLESPGPVFFSQKRTGYWNKSFSCLKFRSMKVNKDCDAKQATSGDSRITKIGAFLRKTSLDEFPQFWNVLKGDMSIVGPRPHMMKHTEEYSQLIDSFMIRHAVKPGITGWAQINGWRGPTPELYQMAKRVELDVEYIENWSFFLDLKCIFYTVFNIFKGEENAV